MFRFPRASVIRAAGLFISLMGAVLLNAQRGGADWMTIGNDAQRSNWIRGDGKINKDTMSKPGFQLVWKFKVNNEARQLNSVTPPALIDFYIGYRGFRTLGFWGGSSEVVTAIDTDIARLEWEKKMPTARAAGTLACPGGMTSSVTRPTSTGYPPAFAGRGGGRGSAAKSAVGDPNEGAVTLKEWANRQAAQPPPAPMKANRRTAPAANPFGRTPQFVAALTADGKLHMMYVSNGEEPNPAIAFLPANANAQGLVVYDNVAYVATVNNCGGVEDGVWALNLESKQVNHWKSPATLVGSMGPAVGPDGVLYVAAGKELVALEPGTLKVKATFKSDKALNSTPLVFDHKDRDLVAVTNVDGELLLLDPAAMSGAPLAKTAAFSTAGFTTGALAGWQDAAGTRWILAPAGGTVNGAVKNGAVVAFKLNDQGGSLSLQQGWVSRDLMSPLTPVVVNGVVFALSSGEFRTNDANVTAAQRVQRSSKATLYAIDGTSGKELWNSGATIGSFTRTGGLAAGGGRVYVGAHDGTLYAFSFHMEH